MLPKRNRETNKSLYCEWPSADLTPGNLIVVVAPDPR